MLKLYVSFSEILGNMCLILHGARHHDEHIDYTEVAEIIECITSALSDFLSDLK